MMNSFKVIANRAHKEDDVKLLEKVVRIGKISGIVPIHFQKKNKFLLTYTGIFILLWCFSISEQILRFNDMDNYNTLSPVDYILNTLSALITIIFSIRNYFSILKHNTLWGVLLKKLDNIDTLVIKDFHCIRKSSISKLSFLKYDILNVILLSFYFYLTWHIRFWNRRFLYFFYWNLEFQQIYLLIIVIQITSILNKRISLVIEDVKRTILSTTNRKLNTKIQNWKYIIFLVHQIVKLGNSAFGFQILVIIMGVLIDVIGIFDYTLSIFENYLYISEDILTIVVYFLYFFLILVSAITY